MRAAILAVLPAAVLGLGACGTCRTVSGGDQVRPGHLIRFELRGRGSELTLQHDGGPDLPMDIMTGGSESTKAADTLHAGVTRWWQFDSSRVVLVHNTGDEPADVRFRVRGAGVGVQTGVPAGAAK